MSKNAVAVKAEESTALAIPSELEQFAGLGMDQVRTEDMSIPFLRILAQLSPQVNKRDGAYVDGAEAGMIYNTVENVAYDGEEGRNEGNDDIREANSPESGVASGTCYGVAADF